MEERQARPVPRPFALHWGKGQIVEEAAYHGEYHQPSLQLNPESTEGGRRVSVLRRQEGAPVLLG